MKMSLISFSREKSINLLLLLFLALMMGFVYEQFLFPTNLYLGVSSLFSAGVGSYLLLSGVGLLFLALLLPRYWCLPSDIFISVYIIFVCLPLTVLYPIYGENVHETFLFGYLFNLLPILLVAAMKFLSTKFKPLNDIRIAQLNSDHFVICLMLVCIFVFMLVINSGVNFSLSDFSARRLTARAAFPPGAVSSYMMQATMNMVLPTLAFLFFRKGGIIFYLIPYGMVFLFFMLTGVNPFFLWLF